MTESYLTVSGEKENLIVIERSKFICRVKGVRGEEEAKGFIEECKKRNSFANHNCYAYVADELGLIQKFSDDGEPQGTAGMPMLETLKNKKIFKTVAVVTRYFGGIKLGTGGLARAYGGSVSNCLDMANIVEMSFSDYIFVHTEYDGYSKLLNVIDKNVCIIKNAEFTDAVKVEIAVKKKFAGEFLRKLSDSFGGKIKTEITGSGYAEFK